MPTYEYKCDACGHVFEQFQSITAPPVKKCPACDKKKVKRLIGVGAGLIFKGSGFYITDYRDQGYKDEAKAEAGAATGGSNGEATPARSDSAGEKPAAAAASTDKPAATPEAAPAKSKPARGPSKKGGKS